MSGLSWSLGPWNPGGAIPMPRIISWNPRIISGDIWGPVMPGPPDLSSAEAIWFHVGGIVGPRILARTSMAVTVTRIVTSSFQIAYTVLRTLSVATTQGPLSTSLCC